MSETKIESHKVTKPIQLLAVWFSGLILLVGAFLAAAAANIKDPSWLTPVLVITAIVIVPIFIGLIFILQTKFRTQFLDDPYYADWLKRQEEEFKNFHPENIQPVASTHTTSAEANGETWEEREQRRINKYDENQGIFLIHTWRPSRTSGQIADISIRLHQHGRGPLTEGNVGSVEYHVGPKFFRRPIVKTNADEDFNIDISAYAPMLCLARVNFSDGTPPIDLERYINF